MNGAETWRDAIVDARNVRGASRSAELRRLEETRARLEQELAETRRNQELAAELPALAAKRDQLKRELLRSTEILDTQRLQAAEVLDRLTMLVQRRCRTWLANSDRASVDAAFAVLPDAFATELAAAGIVSGSTAQYEAQLPHLVTIAAGRRDELIAFALRLTSRIEEVEQLETDDARRAAAARAAQDEQDALDSRLLGHGGSGERFPPVVESLRTADMRLVANVHKHVLLPMLADLQFERENQFFDVDPLDALARHLVPPLLR
jgi:hypothetical protein